MMVSKPEPNNNFFNYCKCFLTNEIEIIALLIIFAIWYFQNIPGAFVSSDALYADVAHHYFKGDFHYYYDVNFRPLTFYFLALGEAIFGENSFGYIFFPVIFGLASIYLTYKIGKELGNRYTGFFAAFLIGITPFFARFVVTPTLESTRTFFVLALLYLALKYPQAKEVKQQRRTLILMGIVTACGFTAKQDMIFFILGIFIYLMVRERKYVKGLFKKYFLYAKDVRLIKSTIKTKRISLFSFLGIGVLLGLISKFTLDYFWTGLSPEKQNSVSGKLPPLLRFSITNPELIFSWIYFILVGIIFFIIFWIIFIIIANDLKMTLRWLFKPRKLNRIQKILGYFVVAFACLFIIYIPFLTLPHYLIYRIILNLFGDFIGIYSTATSAGGGEHIVELAGNVYTKPPIWAYSYWIYQYLGFTFVIGLIIAIFYSIFLFITKDKNKTRIFILFYFFIAIPLILYHVRSIKLFYHIFPLFPLFAIYISTHIFDAAKRLSSKIKVLSGKNTPMVVGALCCIILLLIPTSPLFTTLQDPDIKTDSGYDTVSEMVIEYADNHSNETVFVLAHDAYTLEYYMGDDTPDNVVTIDRLWANITEDEILDLLRAGEIDLIVEFDDPRTEDTEINEYFIQNAISEVKLENTSTGTIVYYMKN
ncbi:MAG: glycosyltransferase family 39 protein [Thermoplasmata archaeon]|nr:MAG: glycosyltransferase family 39 protein [Thermoplasmata archaeon]